MGRRPLAGVAPCPNIILKFELMKKGIVFIILIFVFLMSCNQRLDHLNKTVFRYNEANGINSLDPAFSKDLHHIWVCNQLFNGLVQFNDQLEVEACIAKEWRISPDGLIYTFYLHNDVFFHDHEIFELGEGRKVVASDFVYSFNRLLSDEIASPGRWVFSKVKHENGSPKFTAINDSTFQIELKESFPPFLGMLAMKYCSVVPHEVVDELGVEFRNKPIGTGPFYFKYWKEGSKLVFLKNPKYFEFDGDQRLPYLDAISTTFLIDKQAAFLQFVKGDLDFMSGIDASYKDELLTSSGQLNPKFEDDIRLESQPYLNLEYLGVLVNPDSEIVKVSPLKNELVRKAINHGFDRVKMMRYLRNNIGEPALSGVIPKGLPGYSTNGIGYEYNPTLSRKYLEEAGFPNGEGLGEITIATNADYLDLCRYIQHALNEIGFKVNIEVNATAAIRELKAQAKLNFFRASWIADYPDAENYLSMFYSKNFCPNGPNYTQFKNDEFDYLYELANQEVNDEIRIKYYQQMDSIVMNHSVVVPLYYDQVLRFSRKNISGLGSNAVNLLDLKRVQKLNP